MNKSKFYIFTTFILLFILLDVLVYHFQPTAKIKANAPNGYISWELQTEGPYRQTPMTTGQDRHMADINGDSFIDIVDIEESGVFLNPGTGFYDPNNPSALLGQEYAASLAKLSSLFRPSQKNGAGIRVIDINNDGLADIIQSYHPSNPPDHQGIYINTGNGWEEDTRYFIPIILGSEDSVGYVEYNVRFVDLNGDDLLDIIDLEKGGKVYLAAPQN